MSYELPVVPQRRDRLQAHKVSADFSEKGQVSSKEHQFDTESVGSLIQKAVKADTKSSETGGSWVDLGVLNQEFGMQSP